MSRPVTLAIICAAILSAAACGASSPTGPSSGGSNQTTGGPANTVPAEVFVSLDTPGYEPNDSVVRAVPAIHVGQTLVVRYGDPARARETTYPFNSATWKIDQVDISLPQVQQAMSRLFCTTWAGPGVCPDLERPNPASWRWKADRPSAGIKTLGMDQGVVITFAQWVPTLTTAYRIYKIRVPVVQ